MSLIFKQLFERESCTYTYLIADSDSKEAAIVDAVDIMIDRDTALIKELDLDLKFIIETHIHADHITSACPLKKYHPEAKIVMGMENIDAEACSDIMASEGHILPIGNYEITAIETPGHTIGCMSYMVENKILTAMLYLLEALEGVIFKEAQPQPFMNRFKNSLNYPIPLKYIQLMIIMAYPLAPLVKRKNLTQ